MLAVCRCKASAGLLVLVAGRELDGEASLQALVESPGKEATCIHRCEGVAQDTHGLDDQVEGSDKEPFDFGKADVGSSQALQRDVVAVAAVDTASADDRLLVWPFLAGSEVEVSTELAVVDIDVEVACSEVDHDAYSVSRDEILAAGTSAHRVMEATLGVGMLKHGSQHLGSSDC